MTARLTSRMLVSALIRRVGTAGGNAAVLARGDDSAGAILLICMYKGVVTSIRERLLDPAGIYRWESIGPSDTEMAPAYLAKRQVRDPDLWLVELDIANAERFAADLG